jgi:quercetin dioxygenase-like cupin family protein
MKIKRPLSNIVVAILLVILISCTQQKPSSVGSASNETSEQTIFPKGERGPSSNFIGNAYNFGLVSNDSVYNTLVGNVYFEAGARSNWHTHPGGQILVITDGEGYHQIEGQPRETMRKGDVVKCPPNVRHWHGATERSSLSQVYIIPNTEKGIVTWQEPVTEEQYTSNN